MTESEVLKILSDIGVIIKDSHVVYTSGRHGSAYVNKDAIYPHTKITSKLCEDMAGYFRDKDVEVVAGPTVGGVILSQWVAHHLSKMTGREVQSVFAEEGAGKKRIFKRGYDKLIQGKGVLVVEDVLTTGGSVRDVVEAVRAAGGNVIGCVALCNRGGVTEAALGVPLLRTLVSVDLDSWDAAHCPLCEKGIPINTNVGKAKRCQVHSVI